MRLRARTGGAAPRPLRRAAAAARPRPAAARSAPLPPRSRPERCGVRSSWAAGAAAGSLQTCQRGGGSAVRSAHRWLRAAPWTGRRAGPLRRRAVLPRCHRWHRVGARVAVAGSAPPLRASCGRSLTAAGLCVRSRPCFLCTTCVRHFGAQDQPRDRRQRASALRSSQGLAFAAAPRVSSPRAGPAARGAGLRGHVALQCLACRLQADWQHERLAR